jgi:hypothetical protein
MHKFVLMLLGNVSLLCAASFAIAEVSPISDTQCEHMRVNGVFTSDAPVKCNRLRQVTFQHVDFQGQTNTGKIVVLDAVAKYVENIFKDLYERGFPIHKADPIENYQGNDTSSMDDNNTSAYNSRAIVEGSNWSMHAYGVAIDINPQQNPFVSFTTEGGATILPAAAAKTAVNRLNFRPGKVARTGLAEDIVDVFANNGFIAWGGYWDFPIDYQHFQVGSRKFTEKLASPQLSVKDAENIFAHYVDTYKVCMAKPSSAPHLEKRALCVEHLMNNN